MIVLMTLLAATVAPAHDARRLEAQGQSESKVSSPAAPKFHTARLSPTDLEVGGELTGLPTGATRYVTRDDLLALPQVTYTVSDDTNFIGPTRVGGVPLEDLMRYFGAWPASDLVVAISDDEYRGYYPRAYLAQHRPLLVLQVNGKPPSGWPKDSGAHGFDMGPYMISHPSFRSSFKILGHAEEPQIPWGVVRIEFRDEKTVFGAIAPRGPHADDPGEVAGYRIAQQNCLRCHNAGADGGQKSKVSWTMLSAIATSSPGFFASYIHDPHSHNPNAQMPGNPSYDEATTAALVTYFKAFSQPEKP
jgi:mono/diheme cytochrome c family protein